MFRCEFRIQSHMIHLNQFQAFLPRTSHIYASSQHELTSLHFCNDGRFARTCLSVHLALVLTEFWMRGSPSISRVTRCRRPSAPTASKQTKELPYPISFKRESFTISFILLSSSSKRRSTMQGKGGTSAGGHEPVRR